MFNKLKGWFDKRRELSRENKYGVKHVTSEQVEEAKKRLEECMAQLKIDAGK